MASAAGTLSIASSYCICINSFNRLLNFLQVPDCEFSSQISLSALQDELGRFRVWAGNAGAHRSGKVSLDHRLREASQIHEMVTDLLQDLNGVVIEAIAIVSHEGQPSGEFSRSSDSLVSSPEDELATELGEEMNPIIELQECFLEITHVITCLYRFSATIRNPAPRDRLQKCASIDVSHFEYFDVQHTSNKFPGVEGYLADRLGRANSRRRQLLKYHEKHHNKITRYIGLPQLGDITVNPLSSQNTTTNDEKEVPKRTGVDQSSQGYHPSAKKGPATIATTVNTQTTVSTFVQGLSATIEVCSDAGQSQTSYATSISGDKGTKFRVPPPPSPESALGGEPFECPYCYSIVIVHGSKSWIKHVFRDLRPYVCTFRDCPKPNHLFNSRHDWNNHEVEIHRREWFCNACRQPFATKALFESHLRQSHLNLFTEAQLPAVVDRCERAIDSKQICPLCGEVYLPRLLQSHLARHMQQLALFTLPKTPQETNGDEKSVGAQASNSDGEGTRDNFPRGTDLESTSSSPREIIDDAFSTNDEIPETEDERWGYPAPTGGPDPKGPLLESGGGAKDDVEAQYQFPQGKPELRADVIVEMNKMLGLEQQDTLSNMSDLITAYINKEGSHANVLQAAAGRGHARLVEMFLEMGANTNAQGGKYGNALQEAARNGHGEIVGVLLKAGADVNAQGGKYGNALQAAARYGLEEIVKVLLKASADVNTREGKFGDALQAAAYYGLQGIVEVLLKAGADVNGQGGKFGGALGAAAFEGYGEIVGVLLKAGADVNAQGGEYGNALQAAARNGHGEIVGVLLKAGADVNAQGGECGNALQAAACNGHGEIVEVLLKAGADANAQGGEYGNALQAAALMDHGEIVEVLLKAGADVNAQGESGHVLQAAALMGHGEIVEVLLKAGADVNAQGGEYGNALQAAILYSYEEIVEMLLKAGADVNMQGGYFGNALQAAAWGGYGGFVEVLLKAGADVNAQGGKYGNALQAAIEKGHEKVAEMLRRNGTDDNAQGDKYENASQAAARKGHENLDSYHLETQFFDDYVVHKIYEVDSVPRQWREEKWRRVKDIGAGGFGIVLLERETGGKLRAVKRIPREPQLENYRRELEILVELTNDKRLFVQILGWYEDSNFLYIAMEYIEHGSLSQLIRTGNAKSEARNITIQLLNGLKALHAREICHRDLNPQHVLIARINPIWVKIAGFSVSEKGTDLTALCGAPGYVAPEILGLLPRKIKVGHSYTNAVDLWSLGCLVHEILTSIIPFLEIPSARASLASGISEQGYDPEVDMTLLFDYCNDTCEFPIEPLQKSGVSKEGIGFVKSLLVAYPRGRISAEQGLKSLWLLEDEHEAMPPTEKAEDTS